ncbi:cubilin-like isoform X2 [Acropora millepora]|uniref:cubilin-like isoform X2 n=1 Tax=Acropora millepora TaxID=45264 RepID=UPI001CF16DC6|nr:cubilin-like isoform X2 [Acropora millepora]
MAKFLLASTVLFLFYQFSSASVCSFNGVTFLSLLNTTKSLTSPNYPSNYPPDAYCLWSLKRPSASYGVRLTFNSSYLEDSSTCRREYVEIRDGDKFSTSTFIMKFCGTDIPPIIVSKYTYIFVKFVSNFRHSPSQRRYFSASFKAILKVSSPSQCSINSSYLHNNNLQLSSSSGGTLRSPSYPSNYPNNMICTWTITAPRGLGLMLTFNYFRLESGPCSTHDYLEVRDGSSSRSRKKGTYCGTYAQNIISSGRYLWIRFRSDWSLSNKGFDARYTVIRAPVCSSNGVSFLSPSSTAKLLTSPNYPSNYPPSANCFWSLKRPSTSYGVRLTFYSFFVEGSSSCRDDYLEIRDGDTFSTSTFIGKFCGTRIPPIIVSRYTYLFVKFISDSDYYPSQRYFTASFKAILKVSSTSQCSINSPFLYNNNLQLSSSSGGTLRSPSYPSNYPNNMMCTWRITAPSGSRVRLTFNYFRLESSLCSTDDYLEVRDGSSSTSTGTRTYCGTYAQNIISSGRYLWIRFRSDSSLSNKGFDARYTIVTPGICSFNGVTFLSLLNTTKSLTSPNYPSNYPPDAYCLWSLKRPSASYGVRLTFNSSYLEDSSTCRREYVEIRDGDKFSTSTFIMKFCGTDIPPIIVSKYTYIFVKFVSNFRHSPSQRRYFSASFKAILKVSSTSQCSINSPFLYNNNLQLSSSSGGTIRSPSYPSDYPNNMMCTWRITAPSGSRLQLTFNYFRLESSPCPTRDYLEVRDGSSSTSTKKGTYCGSNVPSITSSGRYLWIRFRSDSSVSYKGFDARYTIFKAPVCFSSGVSYLSLSSTTKLLTSPNYPSNYPPSANCFWSLKRPSSSYGVRLTFHLFSLEASSSCRDDYVEIRDGYTFSTSTIIGKFCGTRIPPMIVSRYTYIFVKFISDFDYYPSRRYFSASFKAILKVSSTSQCSINSPFLYNNNLQLSSSSGGTLRSPSYPFDYPNNMMCTWTITAPRGSGLLLTFNYFRLESGPCSTHDYLEVRHGSSSTSTRIGTYCGTYVLNIFSSGRYLWIRFRSDSLLSYKGFDARYTIVTPSICSSSGVSYLSLSSTTKLLTSPNYPSNYPPSANCFWTLKRPSSSYGVRLTFHLFSLEASSSCRDDYVEIRDGDTFSTSTFVRKFCDTGIPPMIVSKYTYIFVKFISDSDYYTSRRYFVASFKAILKVSSTSQCSINSPFLRNNNLQLSSSSGGTLRSPSYPSNYPNNMMCTWKITAPSGSRLMLTFNYFRLENGTCSTHDYLEVRDGSSSTSTRKGTYCGSYAPNMTSSGRYLWIRFRSDSSVSYKGFEARYTILPPTTSKTLVTTTSKTHVGTVVGVVVAIVVALVIIMAVIFLVKKKNRRVTSHSDPTTSAPCAVAMTQGAPNDNVELMPLQFPPPPVSTVPPGSFFSMNVECGPYPPPHKGMTVVKAPPPYASS